KFGARSGQKRRWQFPRHSSPAKDRQQLSWPKFIDFTAELARPVISRHAEAARGIDEHFFMHIAGFDRRNSGNEPTLDLLSAMRPRKIAGDSAKRNTFQICS